MKKIISVFISVVALFGAVLAVSACKPKPQQQVNNMVVKSVTQDAYGSVNVTFDVSGVDFTNADKYYYIQPSLDGGQNWYEYSAYMTYEETKSGEFSFDVVNLNDDGNYYLLGNYNEENKINVSSGDKLSLSFRFKAYENYLVSEATTPVEYTIKSYTKIEVDGSTCEENLPQGGGERYIFQKQQNESFKFFHITPDKDGSVDELLPVDEEILSRLEYKFISKNDLQNIDGTNYLSSELKATENRTDTTGWIEYNAENGITYDDYKNHKVHSETSGDSIDTSTGEIVGTWKRTADEAFLIVRLKASGNSLKSEVKFVVLTINEEYIDN